MRRPVKPFVTEYKGTGRRGKDEAEEPKPKAAEAAPPGKEAGKGAGKGSGRAAGGRPAGGEARGALPPRNLFRGQNDADPIDSYEAAMRAADALFSPKSKAEPSARTAGAPAAREDAAPPPPGQAEPTGRVLRALDEPTPEPPDPMPELAPKRRGRKPGSVNKPKTDARRSEATRRRLADAVPPPEAEEDEGLAEAGVGEPPTHAGAPSRPASAAVPAARSRDRFPWVRTKLGPGEKWKRRLPKVAW